MSDEKLSKNESRRLATLKKLQILDTEQEQLFDSITHGVCRVFSVPISLISLIDETRQWFKSNTGLDARQSPRQHAFCRFALNRQTVFIVNDALEDPKFKNNPLVTGSPFFRFYAGAPIIVEGHVMGTLCAIDTKPRELSDRDSFILESFAKVVADAMLMRKALIEAKEV